MIAKAVKWSGLVLSSGKSPRCKAVGWLVVVALWPLVCQAQSGPGQSAGRIVRLPAIADVGLSDGSPRERNACAGKAPQLKLRNCQDLALIRFDTAALRGREVLEASLFLHRIGPDKLRCLRVSTVNQDWEEGESASPNGPASGASFLLADASPGVLQPWAWPGSSVADVIMSSGNSLGCYGERRELEDGWISVALTPEVVYALAVGDSDGLAVIDGGNPANHENLISSVQAKGYAPFIQARLGEPIMQAPAAPVIAAEPAPQRARLRSGAFQVMIQGSDDVFCWRVRLNGGPVARWRVKHPDCQKATVFYIEDLLPGREHQLEVVAVTAGGQVSPPASLRVRSSKSLPRDVALGTIEPLRPVDAAPLEDGPMRVWPLPGLVKVDPVTGKVVCDDLGTVLAENRRPDSVVNAVWDGKQVGLFGARGECVSFQLCLENLGQDPLEGIAMRVEPLTGPGGARVGEKDMEICWNHYARNRMGQWQPAYCVPVAADAPLSIPNPDGRIPEQRNQTFYVDIHIDKSAPPGVYKGAVLVVSQGARLQVPVALEVLDFQISHRLNFWPELNAFNIPSRAIDYYRVAHDHRCVLNCWAWRPKVSGSGQETKVEWEQYDRVVGPLLTGEAFANGRRPGVPIECMYLPFEDNWPTPLTEQTYHYEGYWPQQGDDPSRIIDHYLSAPPIAKALSEDYKAAFLAVQQQFIEHFEKMGYNQTEMQCFFGGKVNNRIEYGVNTWWTTDEPHYWDDWLALQFFTHLWATGRGSADPRLWTARADISRPQWQGRTLAGLIDAGYYGAGGFRGNGMVRRCRTLVRDTGLNLRTYGSANLDSLSNTETVAMMLGAWADGADAFMPWQSLGSEASLDDNDAGAAGGSALLAPGDRFGKAAVADLRLKAVRDGQQLIEYFTLLADRRRLNREQVKGMIHEATRSPSQTRQSVDIDDVDEIEFASLSAWKIAQLRRRVADLLVR